MTEQPDRGGTPKEDAQLQAGTAMAHLLAGSFDAASSWAEKAFREMPAFVMLNATIAASHALSGRKDQARRAMHQLRQLDPSLSLANLEEWLPFHRPKDLALFADGSNKSGPATMTAPVPALANSQLVAY